MQSSESIRPDAIGGHDDEMLRPIGDVQQCKHDGHTVYIQCDAGLVAIAFETVRQGTGAPGLGATADSGAVVGPAAADPGEVVRVRISAEKAIELRRTDAILAGSPIAPVQTEMDGMIHLSTHHQTVTIQKQPFALCVSRRGETKPFYQLAEVWVGASGSLTVVSAGAEADHFYGLGEKTSFLDKRGESYAMWNSDVYDPHVPEIEALYVSIPFLIHKTAATTYGVLLDNPGKSRFDMRSRQNGYLIRTETGDADLYIIDGRTLAGTVTRYTALTGRMPLPPKWALGYHQSRYSYMSSEEVLEVARTFRAKEIPCDALYLDIHYMDEYRVFTFDEDRFPQPKALTDALAKLGMKLVPIVDPGVKVDEGYHAYSDGMARDMFCKRADGSVYTGSVWAGESTFPDFASADVRAWWAEKQRDYLEQGIAGVWNDMNEPAIFDGPDKTMPGDILQNDDGRLTDHRVIHNLYGMHMAKASYEGQLAYRADRRPFVLTRAGYAGIQRYAAVWTGDNRSFWEHMAMAIPMVLNLGLSGVAFTGPDVGGFAHHTNGELLARWTQMGALFPYFRNHSAQGTLYQEPWRFGERIEQICKAAIELRYRWLPHLYSLFYEAAATGMPVVRPLLLHYPDDAVVTNLCDEFLFGENVLVAPVLRPDADCRLVYLPEGLWYDYWTGEALFGNQHIIAEAPLERLPLFVKAGGILPQTAVAQSTSAAPDGPLIVEIFAGAEGTASTFQLYDDDGETTAHQDGAYTLMELGWEMLPDRATFHYAQLHQGYGVPWQGLELRVRALGAEPVDVLRLRQRQSGDCGDEGAAMASNTPADGSVGAGEGGDLATSHEAWMFDAGTDTLIIRLAAFEDAEDIVILPGDEPVL